LAGVLGRPRLARSRAPIQTAQERADPASTTRRPDREHRPTRLSPLDRQIRLIAKVIAREPNYLARASADNRAAVLEYARIALDAYSVTPIALHSATRDLADAFLPAFHLRGHTVTARAEELLSHLESLAAEER
jgi:hypothetical protein